MVLNKYRSSVSNILTPIARAFSGLHPNTISAVSLIFALLAGIAFFYSDQSRIEDIFNAGHYYYILLAIASICIFLNGFLDAIDGQVARITKRISKRGDFFDHALDRYADILILGGIMLSPYCDTVIGALAIIAVLLTSYMGTQAQALGCGRDYSGILGRADRLVILILAPVIQMWVLYYIPSGRLPLPGILELTILEWTMIWFIIAGNITAIHRGVHSWRELRDLERPQKTLDQFYTVSEIRRSVSNPSKFITTKPTKQTRLSRSPSKRSKIISKPEVQLTRRKTKAKLTEPKPRPKPTKPKQKIRQLKTKHRTRAKQKPSSNTKEEFISVEWEDDQIKPSGKPKSKAKPLKLQRKIKRGEPITKIKTKPTGTRLKRKTKAKSMKLKIRPKPKKIV